MSAISTHVLDTSRGQPGARIAVTLERKRGQSWFSVVRAHTDHDGRARLTENAESGTYRLTFSLGAYFGGESFFPEVAVTFDVRDADQNYHVPLLVSPFGYSTYRGS